MMIKLKPCPFCGENRLTILGKNDLWILCDVCGTESGVAIKAETLAENWNLRMTSGEEREYEVND